MASPPSAPTAVAPDKPRRQLSCLGRTLVAFIDGGSFGAAIGGILIGAVGVVSTYLMAATGVVLSAIAILTIPMRGRTERSERSSLTRDLREGFAYVRERPPLMLALLACSMAIFNGAMGPMRVIFAKYVFEAGPSGFGASQCSWCRIAGAAARPAPSAPWTTAAWSEDGND